MRERKHPCLYKPTSCWMQSVLLTQRNDRPLLTILSSSQDRKQFANMTPCGREEAAASSAKVSLKSEIEMLSGIAGRDFLRELNTPELDFQRQDFTLRNRPSCSGQGERGKEKVHAYSTFCTCSRTFSSSVFARTTFWAMPASLALDPMVFNSRLISWQRKSRGRPTASELSRYSRKRPR